MSTHFSQILAEFGLRIGIPDLSMDTLGHCALQFDEVQLNLLWLQEERNVLCYAPLAIIHPDTHCELIWELMAANNFYLGTRGATLSWDDVSHQCHISQLLDSERMTINAFEQAVQQLVNTAEHWSRRIGQSSQAVETDKSSASISASAFPAGIFGQMA